LPESDAAARPCDGLAELIKDAIACNIGGIDPDADCAGAADAKAAFAMCPLFAFAIGMRRLQSAPRMRRSLARPRVELA
jgi:hypothetical protein